MVTKSRPYIEVNDCMDLDDIEEALSNIIDILFFGIEESLKKITKMRQHPDDREACYELFDVIEKIKDVIDDGYDVSSSDYVERILWWSGKWKK